MAGIHHTLKLPSPSAYLTKDPAENTSNLTKKKQKKEEEEAKQTSLSHSLGKGRNISKP